MDTKREFVDISTLAAQVEDTDFGVGYTTVEARLWIRLFNRRFSEKICPRCTFAQSYVQYTQC